MNREDIIRMAREAGLHLPYWDDDQDPKTDPPLGWSCVSPIGKPLERFAALVSAAEREACAEVCEETTAAWTQHLYNSGCVDCAAAMHSAWVDAAMVLAYDFAEAHYNLQCVNDSNNLHALNTARRALKAHLQRER